MEILIVTVDCLRPSRLGAYGCAAATTPTLDALATVGIVFENVIAQSSWTSPALFSMMTGCNPPAHGVTSRGGRLSTRLQSLPAHFGANGWEVPDVCSLNAEESYRRLGWAPALDLSEALAARSPARLLWTHYERCHLPYAGAPADPRLSPLHQQAVVPRGTFDLQPSDHDAVVAMYDEGVAACDRWLADVVDDWDGRGPLVISADHGEELLERGWVGHTSTAEWPTLYDEVLRVPLLIVGTGLTPRRVRTRVRQIDLAPTLCALARVAPMAPVEGASLLALMAGSEEADRAAYAETVRAGYRTRPGETPHRTRALFDGHWKLVESPEAVHLYDLRDDPGEQRDRRSEAPQIASRLQAALRERARDSRALWHGGARAGQAAGTLRFEDGGLALPDDRRWEVEYEAARDVRGTFYAEGPRVALSPLALRCRARTVEGEDDWTEWVSAQ